MNDKETTMNKTINDIMIVGGGSSGWLCAAYLARKPWYSNTQMAVKISVVESSDIPPIGVGEGTFPSIRSTLTTIGIDEREFLSECSATLKQGIRFVNWNRPENDETH